MIFPSPCSFSLLLKALRNARNTRREKPFAREIPFFKERKNERKNFARKRKASKSFWKALFSSAAEEHCNVSLFFSQILCPLLQKLLFFFWIFFFRFFYREHPKQLLEKKNLKDIKTNENPHSYTHTQNTNTYILMFAATQQIASVAGLKATKVQVCVLPLVLSFFLMIPISSSECSSHRARFWWCEFSSVSNILQKRIEFVMMRERDLISDARCWSPKREWTKTNA